MPHITPHSTARSSTLLFIGDLHLGRLPKRLAASGLDPRALTPRVAWEASVERAISDKVAAVVLAGDVVDDEQDRFEAYDHLERGVRRLVGAGIAVVAVAGNHDSLVLPRLADRIPEFRLLGRGGQWEHHALDTSPQVDLIGWSFPQRHHRGDPLEAPGLEASLAARRPGAALLGVLHADVDTPGSSYAPTTRAGLAGLAVDAWLLGHIHQPGDLCGDRPIGHLGSLVGLDRGEPGRHGPWLVRAGGPGSVSAEQLTVGPLRWENLDVDLGMVADDDGAKDTIHATIEGALRECAAADPELNDPRLQAIGCSVRLTGATPAHGRVREIMNSFASQELAFDIGERRWAVVSWRDHTRLPIDLHELHQQRTPVGALAKLLIQLERGEAPEPAMADAVHRAVSPYERGRWQADEAGWSADQTHAALTAASWRLLDILLRQQAAQGGA